MKFVRAIIICLALAILAHAQDSSQDHFQRFTALPVLAYSEDTELEYGGILVLFFKPFEGSSHVSTIDFVALGTTRKQYGGRISPEFWLLKDQLHIPAAFKAYRWNYSLYERGSRGNFDPIDEYEITQFQWKVPFELNIGIPKWLPLRYGPVVDGETRESDLERTPETKDGTMLGGGYIIALDERDNANWATQGYYASFEEIFYGVDFDFHTETLDVRFYTPLFWRTSLALGFIFKQSKGDVIPLGRLVGPDGTDRFRGVESSLWNDNQAMIWQLEFRRPLFWRLAGTIFGETFQSGPYFSEMFRRQMHYSVGFGGRLALNKSEKLHARGDISFIDGKHIGLTIDLREAF